MKAFKAREVILDFRGAVEFMPGALSLDRSVWNYAFVLREVCADLPLPAGE